ncbi:MAG: single-strand DNA-binding protein, partial [Lentimonas sp.]
YMRKGRPLMVEGRLKLDQWESDGQKRSKLGVVLENFQFLGGRDDADSSSESGYEQSSPPVRSAPPPAKSESPETNFSNDKDTLDDDVPF